MSSQSTESIYNGKTRSNRRGQGKDNKKEKREMSRSVGRSKGRQPKVWYAVLHSKDHNEPFIAVKSSDVSSDYPILETCFLEDVKPVGYRAKPIYYRSCSSEEQAQRILADHKTLRLSAATYNQIATLKEMNDYDYVATISAKDKYGGIHLYSVNSKSSIFHSIRIPASMVDSKRTIGSTLFVCWYLLCRLMPGKKDRKLNIAIMTNDNYLIGMLQNAVRYWVKSDWKNQNGNEISFLPVVQAVLNELDLQSRLTEEDQANLNKEIFCGPRHNIYFVYVPKEDLVVPDFLTAHPAEKWEKGVCHSRVEKDLVLAGIQNVEKIEDEPQSDDIMSMMASIMTPPSFGVHE